MLLFFLIFIFTLPSAIKEISISSGKSKHAPEMNETKILRTLNHENILKYREHFFEGDRLHSSLLMVSELCVSFLILVLK